MAPPRVSVRVHPSTDAFERTTGQPWFTLGAVAQGEMHLPPLRLLIDRGMVTGSLRHQLVHVPRQLEQADQCRMDRGVATLAGVAQLVAVQSKDVKNTWPTSTSPDPKQTFSTENFLKAVVAEIKAKHPIDEERIFTLSWSSGGPAAYAISLAPDTPVKGSIVAMSVFVPQKLPPLTGAKGQRYFLIHSPNDQVTKYFFTRMARTQLTKHGGEVEVLDYEGGHGWRPGSCRLR